MFVVRLKTGLSDRLDSGFYSPEALEAERLVKSYRACSKLGALISDGYRVVYHGIDTVNGLNADDTALFLSPTNVSDEGEVDFENLLKVPSWYLTRYPRGIAKAEELLIEVKGNVSKVAILPQIFPDKVLISGSLFKASLKNDVDASFVLSFLKTRYGQILKNRLTSNSIINYVAKEDLYSIPIPIPDKKAQAYIGEKVRQAERLRQRARDLEKQLQSFFEPLKPNSKQEWELFSRVEDNILTEILTAQTYKAEFLENRQRLSTVYDKLASFTFLFTSIRNGYDERFVSDEGISYLKVADVKANRLNFDTAGKVETDNWNNATIQQRPEQKDLLLTRKGTFGVAAVVTTAQQFLASSEVFVCKPKDKKSAAALSWFLNSYGGRCQFWQFATGTTMPGINQENLAKILVPVFDDSTNEYFNKANSDFVLLSEMSFALTTCAKYLVEGLIEGKITEQELVEAEEGLQAGEREADKAILARMTRQGMDAAHEPALFGDVDALYDALAETDDVPIEIVQ